MSNDPNLQIPLKDGEKQPLEETVVRIYRCTKVVKGGRRFSFGALVVVGDRAGTVGIGYGKANEVPSAVDKAIKDAKKNLVHLSLTGRSIPHRVWGRYGASKLILVPAKDGTGVIAGSAARAVLELAGIHDVLTKSYGAPTPKNLVKATLSGLMALRSQAHVEELRGVKVG